MVIQSPGFQEVYCILLFQVTETVTMPASDLTLTVASKAMVADTVVLFELVRPDGGRLPAFTAGAHVRVQIPGGLERCYSLCNDPAEATCYRIAVHLDPQSRGGSLSMHTRVQAGEELVVSVPANHFALDESAPHTLLVAGGIGITPLLAMAWRLHATGASWSLHYAARNAARCAFLAALQDAPFADKVHLHLDDCGLGGPLDIPALLAGAATGAHLYVCGPSGLIDHVLAASRDAGWADARLHHERFAASPLQSTGNRAFRLVLSRSGMTLEVPADRSVADVVREAGVDLPVSCEQGMCGTCITNVLAGEVDHRDEILSDADRARCFTPCCSRALSDSLTIDL
ncbi:MAG: PDR/VanB family oxidoreductase [Variovorax sp.]